MLVRQSNPSLFVLMGTAAELAPELTRLLDGYHLKAAACVIVPSRDFSHLRAEINRIQQDFLQHRYATTGLARVGYVLHDATDLITLRQHVENILSPLYPSGLITDVYWLADETSTLDSDNRARISSMDVLSGGLPEAQVYLLSNLNSESRHTPWTDVLQTIALLTLFKDGEPREYAVPPDASRYNELLFLQNTGHTKPFLTAGSQRLQVPQKALRAFLLTSLLKPLPISPVSAPTPPLPKTTPWRPEEEYIYGIALPPEADRIIHDKMTRRVILSRLFGTRLDKAADMHPPQVDDLDTSDFDRLLQGFGLFDALEVTKPDGHWPNFLNNTIRGNEIAVATAEKNLQQWLGTPQDLKQLKTNRRRLNYFIQIPDYPYSLVAEYLRRTAEIRAYEKYGEMLQSLLAYVGEMFKKLEERHSHVQNTRAEFEYDARDLSAADSPIAKTDDYFAHLFKDYAGRNAQALRSLTQHYRNEVDLQKLDNYVTDHILKDPAFARSFTEMLTHVADDKSLTEWAVQSVHTHIRLRSGGAALYSEANLHMPADWAAQVKSGCEALGLGRVNLFTDSAANRVSALYHAGAFGPGDLYYADLYK
jgi:hypothetical protein